MLETDARDRIIVAIDCDRERALELADSLSGHAAWLKVGMTLFYAEGPQIVREFNERGFKVFLDLKFHDIPHQVRGAARSAALAGADLLSVHGMGSGAMLAACREGAEAAAEVRGDRPNLVAITVLTSMSQDSLSEIGVESPVADEAARLASLARANGIDGIVCSPMEAASMRELLARMPSSSRPACAPRAPTSATRRASPRRPRRSSAARATSWWDAPSRGPTTLSWPTSPSSLSWSKAWSNHEVTPAGPLICIPGRPRGRFAHVFAHKLALWCPIDYPMGLLKVQTRT